MILVFIYKFEYHKKMELNFTWGKSNIRNQNSLLVNIMEKCVTYFAKSTRSSNSWQLQSNQSLQLSWLSYISLPSFSNVSEVGLSQCSLNSQTLCASLNTCFARWYSRNSLTFKIIIPGASANEYHQPHMGWSALMLTLNFDEQRCINP